MSSIYSAELAASVSDLNEQGCEPPHSAKQNLSAAPSLQSVGQAYPSMTMCANSPQLDWLATESAPSTSSAAASPAKTLASQGKAQDLPEPGRAFGTSFTGSSKKLGRSTPSLKTSQPFDLKDWTKSCGHSLRSGMTRNGIVYPLPPLAPLTAGTESGLWPTPTAVWRPMEGNVRIFRAKVLAGEMTEQEATAMLGKSPFAAQGTIPAMWPTPAARDYKGANHYESTLRKLSAGGRSHLGQLPNAVQMAEGYSIRGQLNPAWVEWLMGFPIGHTDLKHWETPSSRKSRKFLAK